MPSRDSHRFRPKAFPPPQFPPQRLPLFSRMPPAVFPSIMGLLGLGLALRLGLRALGLPGGPAEMLLGAVSLLFLFSLAAYLSKIARRPGVVTEDIAVLPGRTGIAAMTLCVMLFALVLVPYDRKIAEWAVYLGLALHSVLAMLVIRYILTAPEGAGGVTPVWHLHFVGFVIGGVPAAYCGLPQLALAILWLTIPVAVAIWGISLMQLIRRVPPAPLRPLLAIHLSPAALFALLATALGQDGLAQGFVILGGGILIALLLAGRWLTRAGFSALWGAFTFPMAAYAAALFAVGWDGAAVLVLAAALGVVPVVAVAVLKSWAAGTLAAKSNAAQA
ncbi:MAG: tellurium resistance protein [Paracoccaceae bacterium]|nr:tellurium resistance protein [Paracoccaceae bacterium]